MRNLNASKLCNGLRLRELSLKKKRYWRNSYWLWLWSNRYIAWILMITNDGRWLSIWIKAYTISHEFLFCCVDQQGIRTNNESNGNLLITQLCFTHGQFYVAYSRVSSEKTYIMCLTKKLIILFTKKY